MSISNQLECTLKPVMAKLRLMAKAANPATLQSALPSPSLDREMSRPQCLFSRFSGEQGVGPGENRAKNRRICPKLRLFGRFYQISRPQACFPGEISGFRDFLGGNVVYSTPVLCSKRGVMKDFIMLMAKVAHPA
jgi:hypothetical protein